MRQAEGLTAVLNGRFGSQKRGTHVHGCISSWADTLSMIRVRHPTVADDVVITLSANLGGLHLPKKKGANICRRRMQVSTPQSGEICPGLRPGQRVLDEAPEPGAPRHGWQRGAAQEADASFFRGVVWPRFGAGVVTFTRWTNGWTSFHLLPCVTPVSVRCPCFPLSMEPLRADLPRTDRRALLCWRVKWVDAGLMKLASSSQVSRGPKPGLSRGPSRRQQDEHGTGDGAHCRLVVELALLGVDGTPPSTGPPLFDPHPSNPHFFWVWVPAHTIGAPTPLDSPPHLVNNGTTHDNPTHTKKNLNNKSQKNPNN